MAAKATVLSVALVALCLAVSAAAFQRSLLQSDASAPGEAGKPFDWGRPCTLFGNSSDVEITGPGNAACTPCGSGATATPEPTCTFKPLTFPVGSSINIGYHSSGHHLYIGAAKCDFTTEICPDAPATEISATKPCTYKFTTPGSFYISDKSSKDKTDSGEYCKDFGAALPVTVTAAT